MKAIKQQNKKAGNISITGIELEHCTDERPLPIIHVSRNKDGVLKIEAADFIAYPSALPQTEEEASADVSQWAVPKAFQTPHIACSINSNFNIVCQSENIETALKGVDKPYRARILSSNASTFPIISAMPEFLAAWMPNRFEEGRKPTVSSIQNSETARLNAFTCSKLVSTITTPILGLIVFPFKTAIVAFDNDSCLFYREWPVGYEHIYETVCNSMNIDYETADQYLNDISSVDLTFDINPILIPLMRQVEISARYVSTKHHINLSKFVLMGVPSGIDYWKNLFKSEVGGIELEICNPFEGVELSDAVEESEVFKTNADYFINAFGAACAAMEDL